MAPPSVLVLLLASCGLAPDDGAKPVDSCTTTFFVDVDGDGHGNPDLSANACDAPDGYAAVGDDCDDDNPAIHPDADEICDGLDDDCDGSVDANAIDTQTWYPDADLDGFGGTPSTSTCVQPDGYVAADGDCDDTATGVHPGALEICDGVDDDCDALTDEDDPDLIDGTTWYPDADDDGYGDAASGVLACVPLDDSVLDDTDCDDTNAAVRPDAEEVCDTIDNDCDGLVDDDDDPIADSSTFYVDADGDGFGDAAVAHVGCVQPADSTDNDDDCDDTDPEVGAPVEYYDDIDLDGYGRRGPYSSCFPPGQSSPVGGDCDDREETISPGRDRAVQPVRRRLRRIARRLRSIGRGCDILRRRRWRRLRGRRGHDRRLHSAQWVRRGCRRLRRWRTHREPGRVRAVRRHRQRLQWHHRRRRRLRRLVRGRRRRRIRRRRQRHERLLPAERVPARRRRLR